MPVAFPIPPVVDNKDGWGPCTVPEHLKDVPFAPFGKGDRIGKAGDWNQNQYGGGKYGGRFMQGGVPVFNFFGQNEEEESFHVVDNRPVKTQKFGGQRRGFQQNRGGFQQNQRRDGKDGGREQDKTKGGRNAQQRRQQFGQRDNQRPSQYSSGSVEIKSDYQVVEQVQLVNLSKLRYDAPEPEDLVQAGSVEYYDRTFEKVSVKNERRLEKSKRVFFNVTTSDDPIIQELATSGAGRVFATEAILASIMCMKSSMYGWDLLATRKGDQLFLDWRPNTNADKLTVNENAPPEHAPQEEPKDNMNSVSSLALEATAVNQSFGQQVLAKDGNRLGFERPNPFAAGIDAGEVASCAYRYRKWDVELGGDKGSLGLVVRCEVDGAIKPAEGPAQLILARTHNEYDTKVQDYRKKLEAQKGAVLLSEAKNNRYKLGRWFAAALLGGAEAIKMGFTSRAGPRDPNNHSILAVHTYKPKADAKHLIDWENCWGVVRAMIDRLMQLDEGKYLLLKDANKDSLRIYRVPDDAFAGEDEVAEGDDDQLADDAAVAIVPVGSAIGADEDV